MEKQFTTTILLLTAILFTVLFLQPVSAAQEEGNVQSKEEQEISDEVKELMVKAENGDAKAQFSLGCAYDFGKGIQQDSEKAAEWYARSAEQGYAKAQYYLGCSYYYGDGVKQDYEKAVEWYTKSAEQGYAQGQCNLGYMYENGYGVEKNIDTAIEWYTKAAEQGNKYAKDRLEIPKSGITDS